ncbi:MAG: hypothetical protein AB1566_14285 [Chloroflexota bacterium]
MSKKLILLLVALLVALVPLVPTGTARAEGGAQPSAKAVLRNPQDVQRIELPVEVQMQDLGNDRHIVTYITQIPRRYLIASGNSKTVSKFDPSYSARLTLQQVYWEKWVGGYRTVAVDYYAGMWELFDGSVSMRDAYMQAMCYGHWADKPGFCNLTELRWVGYPSLGVWYFQYPSWAGQYLRITEFEYQEGRIDVTLSRGGSTWQFGFCVSQGGGAVIGCD